MNGRQRIVTDSGDCGGASVRVGGTSAWCDGEASVGVKDREALKLTDCQEARGPDTSDHSLSGSNPLQTRPEPSVSPRARWMTGSFPPTREEVSLGDLQACKWAIFFLILNTAEREI